MNPLYYVFSVNGLLFILSIVFYFFPPKKINALYGYRTHRTMKNETIWKFANNVFKKQFLMYSGMSFIAAIVFSFSTKELSWQPMAIMLLSLAVSVIKTEQEITKNFDEEGEAK